MTCDYVEINGKFRDPCDLDGRLTQAPLRQFNPFFAVHATGDKEDANCVVDFLMVPSKRLDWGIDRHVL